VMSWLHWIPSVIIAWIVIVKLRTIRDNERKEMNRLRERWEMLSHKEQCKRVGTQWWRDPDFTEVK
jgi:hypothetical protein